MDEAVMDANPGLDSALDAAFSSDGPTAGSEPPVSAATEASPSTTSTETNVPTVQEEAAPDATVETAEGDEVVPDLGDPEIAPEGKGYRVSRNRLDNLRAMDTYAQEAMQYAPTVEDARANWERASDFQHFQSDFEAAPYDPDAAEKIMNFLDGSGEMDRGRQQSLRSSFVRMAEMIPDRLQKIDPAAYSRLQERFMNPDSLRAANPQTYQKMERAIAMNLVRSLYQAAKSGNFRQTGTPAYNALRTGQWLEQHLSGKFTPEEGIDAMEAPDPLATERQQLEAERAEIERMKTAGVQARETQYQQQWQNAAARVEQVKSARLDSEIAEVLKLADGKFAPRQIEAFKSDLRHVVADRLSKDVRWNANNTVSLRDIRIETINRHRAGQPAHEIAAEMNPRIEAVVQSYLAKARGIVQREAPLLISAATQDAVNNNKATHARAQAGQQKRGVAGRGVPSKQVNAADLSKAKNFDDKFEMAWNG